MKENIKNTIKFVVLTILVTTGFATIASAFDSDYGGGGGGGGGGGTGGPGVITSELLSKIAKSETVERNLKTDIQTRYVYTSSEMSIYELLVKSKKDEEFVAIRVETLNNVSKIATSNAPGNVYKNENVWLGSKDIYDVILRFRVANSWINDNKVNKQYIQLLKWGNSWTPLEVKEINSDENYTYFESAITQSSILAISANSGASTLEDVKPSIYPPTEVTNVPDGKDGKDADEKKDSKAVPGFEINIVIAIIAMVFIAFSKSRKL